MAYFRFVNYIYSNGKKCCRLEPTRRNKRSLAIKKNTLKCYHIKNCRDHKSVATDV